MAGERKKYWKELTADEKIERIREIVKSEQARATRLNNRIEIIEKKIAEHSHLDGKVVMKIERYSGSRGSDTCEQLQPRKPDEVLF